MPRVLPSMTGKGVGTIDVATLAGLLWDARNRFVRVIWESTRNQKRLRVTNNPYAAEVKAGRVKKLMVATVRNDFSFRNSVANEVARQGEPEATENWTPQARTWGKHIPHTPFVVHQIQDEVEPLRLHSHFLPTRYHTTDETGYYVEGEKIDNDELKPFEPQRKPADNALDRARQKRHPVNARLDDVLYIKISGHWYRIKKPTVSEIETLSASAIQFGEQVEAEAAVAV